MCGIAGQINKTGKPVSREKFQAMVDCIQHRGPDDEGLFFEENVALGHRRLAIIDLSKEGKQPMRVMQRYYVVYNGEIYNYIELREELKAAGYAFDTQTDTEVLVKAYDKWGEAATDRFNGMWAFAIYDTKMNTLFFSRDRFGIKPFYYYEDEETLVFGSEIKQLLPFIPNGPIMNRERAMDFLINAYTEYDENTFFKNVKQLRPGWNGTFDVKTNQLTTSQWYDLSKVKRAHSRYKDACREFRTLFQDAVRLRLRADVPVGACLSGGLDSTAIVCEMARLRKAANAEMPITISSCYKQQDELRFDEQEYMDAVVADTDVLSEKVFPDFQKAIAEMDDLIYHMDEPIGSMSICAQREVFAGAKRMGRTVMLDGQGADEQLAGYSGFFAPAFFDLYRKGRWGTLIRELAWFSKYRAKDEGTPAVNYLYPVLNRKAWQGIAGVIRKWKKTTGATGPAQADAFNSRSDYKPKNLYAAEDFRQFTLDMICRNLPALLHYEDRNSMTYSIESRVPFMDYRLVEFIFSLPATYKIRHGVTKAVMRDALRGQMTEKVRTRFSKLGFAAPEKVWILKNSAQFRAELSAACDQMAEIINKENVLSNFDNNMQCNVQDNFAFRLIVLVRWLKIFNVRVA